MEYDWRYGNQRCRLLWTQRQYDQALVEFEDGSEAVVPYCAVEVWEEPK